MDVEINNVEQAVLTGMINKHEAGPMANWLTGHPYNPVGMVGVWEHSSSWSQINIKDFAIESMIKDIREMENQDEQNELLRFFDRYGIEKFWAILTPKFPAHHAHNPWIQGYHGEDTLGGGNGPGAIHARIWVNPSKK